MVQQMRCMIKSCIKNGVFLCFTLLMTCCSFSVTDYPPGSDWKKVSTHKLPNRTKVYTGNSKSGKLVYWIKFRGTKVYLSEEKYHLFQEGETYLYITKSRHIVKNVTQYSIYTKEKKQSKE